MVGGRHGPGSRTRRARLSAGRLSTRRRDVCGRERARIVVVWPEEHQGHPPAISTVEAEPVVGNGGPATSQRETRQEPYRLTAPRPARPRQGIAAAAYGRWQRRGG
jgi:hypothetical protein